MKDNLEVVYDKKGQCMAWVERVVFSVFCSCCKRIRPAAHESGTGGEITSLKRGQQVKSSTRVTAHSTKPEKNRVEGGELIFLICLSICLSV